MYCSEESIMATRSNKKIIKEFCRVTPVTSYIDCIQYLDHVYHYVKSQCGPYSYMQFAVDLGFSRTNIVHQIIKGYRKFTLKTAVKIRTELELKGVQKKYFDTLVAYRNEISSVKRDEIFTKLIQLKMGVVKSETDRLWLNFFSIWYIPIILEILQLDQFENSTSWIAAQINPPIKETQVEESLELLTKLKLVQFDEASGKYKVPQISLSSGHEVRGLGFIRYHQRMIELAKESITRVNYKYRDISSVTFSCDEETLKDIKSMIHSFNESIQLRLEKTKDREKVFQLNTQLFPVSNLEK